MSSDGNGSVVAHLFADYGVEGEVLARVGEVTRYTIDPEPNGFIEETIQMDLMEESPERSFDLAVLHPRCTDVSDMTSISGDADDHPNQIPRAREIAQSIADDYVIENKPRDDLIEPTVVNGKMYGLPIHYERAFEASFPIKTPPRERQLTEKTVSPYYYSDRSKQWWRVVKGYHGEYPKQHLAKNALPRCYVETIVRSWLEARTERDGSIPQDSGSKAPPEITDNQSKISEVLE